MTIEQERDALRAECLQLREALSNIGKLEPRTVRLNVMGMCEECFMCREMQGQALDALASTPLSEKVAAVLRAAVELIELNRRTRQAREYYLSQQRLREAVDDLQAYHPERGKSGV